MRPVERIGKCCRGGGNGVSFSIAAARMLLHTALHLTAVHFS